MIAIYKKSVDGAGRDFVFKGGYEIRDGARAEIAFAAMADADRTGFGFLGTDDEHVGNFLKLRIADFRRQFFVAFVQMDAERRDFSKFRRGGLQNRYLFADRQIPPGRGKPQRKRPGIVLDQNAEEAFDGTEECAMDHQWLVARAVFADKFQVEARGKIEIELDSGELPRRPMASMSLTSILGP